MENVLWTKLSLALCQKTLVCKVTQEIMAKYTALFSLSLSSFWSFF